MLTDLTLLCLPLSIPSLYIAYRLVRRGFLGTVFNQQIALMMVYSGKTNTCCCCFLLLDPNFFSRTNRPCLHRNWNPQTPPSLCTIFPSRVCLPQSHSEYLRSSEMSGLYLHFHLVLRLLRVGVVQVRDLGGSIMRLLPV